MMEKKSKKRVVIFILVVIVAIIFIAAYLYMNKMTNTNLNAEQKLEDNQNSLPTENRPQNGKSDRKPLSTPQDLETVPSETVPNQAVPDETIPSEDKPAEVIPEGQALELPEIAPNFRTMTAEQKQDIIEQARRDAIASALAAGQNQQQAESFGEMAVEIATKAIARPLKIEVEQ